MKKFPQFLMVVGFTVLLLLTTASFSVAVMVMWMDDLSTVGVDVIIVDNADGGVGTSTALGVSNYADINPTAGTVGFDGAVGTFTSNVMVGSGTYNIRDRSPGNESSIIRLEGTHTGKGKLIAGLTVTDLVLDHNSPLSTRQWTLENGYRWRSTSNNPNANMWLSHVAEIGYIGLGNEENENDIMSWSPKMSHAPEDAVMMNRWHYTTISNHSFRDQLEPGSPFSMTSLVSLTNLPKKADVTQYSQHTRIFGTPEPTTILLLGAGLVGLAVFGRKKFKK